MLFFAANIINLFVNIKYFLYFCEKDYVFKFQKSMKYILRFLILVFLAISCGTSKKAITESMVGYTKYITEWQLDSLCNADNIPRDEWFSITFYDYESGVPIIKSMYIKENTYYFITPIDSLYEFSKRIIYE